MKLRALPFLLLLFVLLIMAGCRAPAEGAAVPTAASAAPIVKATTAPAAAPPTATPEPTAAAPTVPAVPAEWVFPMKGEILSSAALADGALYFGSYDYNVYAVDKETGEQRWAFETGDQVVASPAVAGGRVFIGSMDGTFYALDAETGEQLWAAPAGASFASPVVAGGLVYYGTVGSGEGSAGEIVALDTADGSEVWRFAADREIISSPKVADGVLYEGAGTDVVALDAATGEEVWRFDAPARFQGSPAVSDDAVYIGGDDGIFYALDRATGEVRWQQAWDSPIIVTPWIEGDVVYAAPINGQLVALDAATGDVRWTFQMEGMIGSPSVADGVLYAPGMDGTLVALNAADGAERWRWASAGSLWATPLIADGRVFIGSHDRHFYALDASGPRAPSVAYRPPLVPQPTRLPGSPEPSPAADGTQRWWNDRVFYEVFVRSFADSDGDGIGDLQGLIGKLDYLNDGDPATTDDLGVTGIWLMPVAQSPSYHGYDTSDYYTVEEDYGTNEDFKQLMEEAHKRGIAVIVDLVMNHTSSEHPWFRESRRPGSEKENWYIWATTPGNYLSPWGSQVWHQDILRYFYGIFWVGMPDLNYNNGDVTAAMYDIIRYWLDDMGADGFRLDAVRHLIENGPVQENTPATHAWLGRFHDYVHTVKPEAMTVGEVWDDTAEVLRYIPNELDTAFEFDLATAILNSVKIKSSAPAYKVWSEMLAYFPEGQYATFVANHDQDRVFSQLRRDEGAAKVAASMYLTGPGVPFIYYGEEIGMVGAKPDEDIRRPMAWDDTPLAGFTTGAPWEALPKFTAEHNVAAEAAEPASLLNHYKALVALRNAHPALRTGSMALVKAAQSQVAAYLRNEGDETLLVVINLSDKPVTGYDLSFAAGPLAPGIHEATVLMGEGAPAALEANGAGGFDAYTPMPELAPRSTLVLQFGR